MGLEIDRDHFTEADFERFRERLSSSLRVLERLLAEPDFGVGERTIGAELEVALVGPDARPLPHADRVLAETVDPRMTVELDRFNLECNLRHGPLAGTPFAALRAELEAARSELARAAARHAGRIVTIGILPTVLARDLDPRVMTDSMRYRALENALREARQGPFQLHIDGREPLQMACDSVVFEGAATSLQIHLRVSAAEFGPLFNALQVATAPALAASGNSPFFVGHALWEETRVALFKQAVDERDLRARSEGRPPRVGFGRGWVEEGAFELFRDAVEVFPPLLPVLDDEDPLLKLAAGERPGLREIRLHQGTVWSWNRPVYDPAEGGHLRIELRALPSGPTLTDMLANMAFLVGLGLSLRAEADEIVARLAFADAHSNFYRAAQHGLAAELVWPDGLAGVSAPGDRIRAARLAAALVDVARRGLAVEGVAPADADPLLDVFAARVEHGQTGAVWQRSALSALEPGRDREHALEALVEHYLEQSERGDPVHDWPALSGRI